MRDLFLLARLSLGPRLLFGLDIGNETEIQALRNEYHSAYGSFLSGEIR